MKVVYLIRLSLLSSLFDCELPQRERERERERKIDAVAAAVAVAVMPQWMSERANGP